MNQWPMASDYALALQNPQVFLKDPHLKKASIKRDARNLPLGLSGAFAVVYKATLAGNQHRAVRVFTSEGGERTERYRAIHAYLDANRGIAPLVGFEYHEKGIRTASGKAYPLLVMDWVEGDILYEWVKQRCQNRDQARLAKLCDRWAELVETLDRANIAHGDLQHANVLVGGGGELRLVDYDCMCVPQLIGRPNLEVGVDPYQHPGRNGDTLLSPRLDDFSAIFIFVALRALAADPGLWKSHVDQSNYDKLLIRRSDFESPGSSSLYQALLRSPDAEVQRMARDLWEIFRGDISQVPPLRSILFSFDRVRNLLTAKQWDEAIELLSRSGGKTTPPPDLRPAIAEAQQRVDCRRQLTAAVRAGDESEMARLYQPKLLDDYPAAQSDVTIARSASLVLRLTKELLDFKTRQSWREFVRCWDANRSVLDTRKSTQSLRTEVDRRRTLNVACDEVLAILGRTDPVGQLLDAAWKRVVQLGGHPELATRETEIRRRIDRDVAWQHFMLVPRVLTEDADRSLIVGWKDALFQGWALAAKEKPAVDESRRRLAVVDQLKSAAATISVSITSENQFLTLANQLPTAYEYLARGRVEQARTRLACVRRFQDLLADSKVSESPLAAAWKGVVKADARMLLADAQRARGELAEKRDTRLAGLRAISPTAPLSQRDQCLLQHWEQDDLLVNCPEAAAWKEQLNAARQRRVLLSSLADAIKQCDDESIDRIVTDPLLANYDLPKETLDMAAVARGRATAIRDLWQAVTTDDVVLFARAYQGDVLRDNAVRFLPHRDRLASLFWRLGSEVQVGIRPLQTHQSVVPQPGFSGTYRVKWQWPHRRFTTSFVAGICRTQPAAEARPENVCDFGPNPITLERYESGPGWIVRPPPNIARGIAVVWAEFDLGDCLGKFYSRAVVLGRLGSSANRGKR